MKIQLIAIALLVSCVYTNDEAQTNIAKAVALTAEQLAEKLREAAARGQFG